ncbi:MAG TPA: Sua5/YciO/YrdC/YwlC family protein, partial [Bacteroidales bacterium]|nr:Sua5/YciO/YrdC/YwlC family protein [Bacteroidales bacterium]
MTEKEKLQTEIENAAKVIKKGGVILYPTDTIWGLGCDATNAKAVKKIFLIKRRAVSKSLIILAESVERIYKHVDTDKEYISDLVNGFDRPTTIIYPGAKKLAKNV